VWLSVDFPHQSNADDGRDQPTGHNDGSAVLELGGDESSAQDPDDLEGSLWDSKSNSTEGIADETLAVSRSQ
jgi:hypothetical protein